jgi:hypothetical protein
MSAIVRSVGLPLLRAGLVVGGMDMRDTRGLSSKGRRMGRTLTRHRRARNADLETF